MNDGFGALQSALGGFDRSPGISADSPVGPEFLQASGDDLRQVALLVALGDLDGFVNLAFAQRAGNGGAKARDCLRAALKAIQRSIMTPIDQPDMMNRMTTTHFAGMPIRCQIEIGSHRMVPPSVWKSQKAAVCT